jgi:hypothetical protein
MVTLAQGEHFVDRGRHGGLAVLCSGGLSRPRRGRFSGLRYTISRNAIAL